MHRGADRLNLLGRVAELLTARGIPFALIGAAAMAVHGVTRATRDLDLLITVPAVLDHSAWSALTDAGVGVDVRRGSTDDPLAGVVRISSANERGVDVVVGRHAWQAAVVERAADAEIDGQRVPVARAADLILLKLYAGGPQDAWDIVQLLQSGDRDVLVEAVTSLVPALPLDARALWQTVLR